jgi:hypothetical protein
MTTKTKYLSTTALSKELEIPLKEFFSKLVEDGFIVRENNNWSLTIQGTNKGGTYKTHQSGNTYIVWPNDLIEEFRKKQAERVKLLNATALSKMFGISRNRINPIISELGWIQKNVKGWTLTPLGKLIGGQQFEHEKTGVPYINWPESILERKRFIETIKEARGEGTEETIVQDNPQHKIGFREKFEAKHRTADGHYVRSKAEMLIDNWLYMSEIVHAYERKLPIEEDLYCDFYLPVGKVYIEYWGYEENEKYLTRKKEKLRIYQKYDFNLIELTDSDIQNLDDILPKKLLKFGIQAY